jgi:hypothetical protein
VIARAVLSLLLEVAEKLSPSLSTSGAESCGGAVLFFIDIWGGQKIDKSIAMQSGAFKNVLI